MKKIYKILPLLFLIVFSNLNISSYSSEMYCWEETKYQGDFSKNNKMATNAKATDSYLYDTLKDKATIIPVGVVSYKNNTESYATGSSAYGYGFNEIYTKIYHIDSCPQTNYKTIQADATFLKFCAVFNSSGSSSGGSSGAATASVNYIIKAK